MKATTKQVLVVSAWLAILLAVVGGTTLWQRQVRKPHHTTTALTVTSTERIPTVLLLDPKLTASQSRQLIATMQRNNGSQALATCTVTKNDTVRIQTQLQPSDNRPYLKLQIPQTTNDQQQAHWIKIALADAQAKLHFTRFNLVCYGTGGLVATNYLENTTAKLSPTHLITIATPFNGTSLTANEQSSDRVPVKNQTRRLKQLIANRRAINAHVKVLLIAGNAKGKSKGDGVVPIQSALAGQSIFQPVVNKYQDHVIHTWHATHVGILESWQLGDTIQEFLN